MSLPGCSSACSSTRPFSSNFAEIVGIGDFVQRAADDRLRLLALGYFDRFKALFALGDPAILADEVDEIGALHQQLRHDGVVVVLLGQMAIGAGLGFCRAAGGDRQAVKIGNVSIFLCGPATHGVGHVMLNAMPLMPSAEMVCCCT